ncbi:MAG TPA: DUF2911 domain-containing protein [Cyclobacteriaceae bacterium]|jgi:hypothetical protein|nr:DUF2911 domain-containing protein [Cyclobacteriaceae bacterium]
MIQRKVSLLAILLLPIILFAQETKPRVSPLAMSTARYKDAYLKITYSQPSKKGREVFGRLVPFGEVWQTGDNEATEITVTRDILINGIMLKAGTYSIFTIPNKETWTIILNGDVGLWGSYNYNMKTDVLRFDVPVQPLSGVVYETFAIGIDQKNDKAEIAFLWDKTKVSFTVQFNEPKP